MDQKKAQDEVWALVKKISKRLGEKESGPRYQIAAIIRYCGTQFAQNLLEDTLKLEAQGGVMLPDNSRRRTAGGVFFYLARERMEPDLRRKVFYGRGQAKRLKEVTQQSSQPSEPDRPVFNWEERHAIVEILLVEKGEISTVKVTLIGRPGQIEMRQDLVITTMSHTAKAATLPKGVPTPPSTPTIYTVYIGLKQWRKVEESIANPEDMLIVEGTCAFDPELQVIAVYATNVTTKLMDAKRREQQKTVTATESKADSAAPKKRPPDAKQPSQKLVPKPLPADAFPVPAGMPADEVQKLSGLHASAALFRQKITAIQSKPADQQSGLEMTQKLLKGVEDQIAALEKKYN